MTEHVTAQGLTIPTVEDLLADIVQDEQANIDPNIDTQPESLMGSLNGIFANQLREAWEVLEIAYNGFNPDAAEGFLLESISALTGTKKQGATASFFNSIRPVMMTLQANKTIPAGTVFSQNGNPSVRFATTAPVTSTIAGDYPASATCDQLGPIACNAGTLIVIETPVNGLVSVTNPDDAFIGTDEDKDPQLRLRREQELRDTGRGTVPAIQAALLSLKINNDEPVISCTVTENYTSVIDPVSGLPPKSFEALIFDGLSLGAPNDELAQTIWETKPAGIQPVGNSTGNATDSNGIVRAIPFSRPNQVETDLAVSISIDATAFAGDLAVKQAVLDTFAKMVRPSKPVRFSWFIAAISAVPGVTAVESIQLGLHGVGLLAAFTDLSLGTREISYTQTADIAITHV